MKTVSTIFGSTQLYALITYFDPLYFPDLSLYKSLELFSNTSQILPFAQADPSCAFIGGGAGADTQQGYAVGSISGGKCAPDGTRLTSFNGATPEAYGGVGGNDFIFQADANASISGVRETPEPGSLALLAGGLLTAGLWRRRRTSKN